MFEKSAKSTENKCTHCAMRLVLKGKDAHPNGNIKHVRYWLKAIASNLCVFFTSKIAKLRRISVPTV